jgi:2-amino-4-hydroxy-6-hydroxymethyldihydropteridine diphosphokinase
MLIVFLLLGSNLGDRHAYLEQAIGFIEKEIAPVTTFSSVFETQAWGKTDTPDYLNQVITLESGLSAQTILQKILAIEKKMGRTREEKWGSRTIDIDILFYGQEIINFHNLIIPHAELHKRRFTLEPLAELAPEFIHPVLKKSILALKNELNDNLIVKKL